MPGQFLLSHTLAKLISNRKHKIPYHYQIPVCIWLKFWRLPSHSSNKSYPDWRRHRQWPLPKCSIPREWSGSLKPWLQQRQFTNLLLSVILLKSTWGLYLPSKFARWTFLTNLKKFRFNVKEAWEVAVCVYYVETGHTNTMLCWIQLLQLFVVPDSKSSQKFTLSNGSIWNKYTPNIKNLKPAKFHLLMSKKQTLCKILNSILNKKNTQRQKLCTVNV